MTKLFLDFDGVVNFDGSRSKYNRNRDALGYVRRNSVYSPTSSAFFDLNYSGELVRKLNDLHRENSFTWLWLTTWVHEAVSLIDSRLGTESDGFVSWNPHEGVTVDNVVDERARRKYAALKETYNNEPFVWVDDDATREFKASDFTVPTLVITPDPVYGITRPELSLMAEFFTAYKN